MVDPGVAPTILALENAALTRWCAGDPSGFLEICADDVVYFDPFLDRRMDGLTALTRYYEALRGKISAERFELINPHVHAASGMAVLTFNFVSFAHDGTESRWNGTEVYRKSPVGWRLIQSHWSFTHPG
jgi:ketosteroid isomerase-like protein